MFRQLQEEHKEWATRNFGKQEVTDYQLGLIEEVGELAHAVLKRKQGIRCNEDHGAMIRDAVGDIVIYLAGYCNCTDIDLDEIYYIRNKIFLFQHKTINSVKEISRIVNIIINNDVYYNIIVLTLFNILIGFCDKEGINFEETVIYTWKNVVSKRNWIDHAETGSPV